MEKCEIALIRHPFFKNLKPEFAEFVCHCAKNVEFAKSRYIFREGDKADWFYIIQKGSVQLEIHAPNKGTIPVQTIHKNEVLGWSWLFAPYKWQFDAKALENIRAIALDAKALRKFCDENHEFGYQLMRRVSQVFGERLQATRIQLLDLYGASH